MFSATRRWFRRNRTPIAVGVGVLGAGYVVTQYVLGKINEARERMSSDRIAKENLRRRFEQNQEDCTFTVLALLPTATTNILEAMNTEKITYEIQQMKGGRSGPHASATSPPRSIAETTLTSTDDDGRSMISMQSESGVHASQYAPSPTGAAAPAAGIPSPTIETTAQDGVRDSVHPVPRTRKTKRQLWDDLTISSITRAFTLLYTLGLLTMLTRVQLNLLGRRSYLSSVVSLATSSAQATISLENKDDDNPDPAYGDDFDVNRKYLTFSWWLLNRGYEDIMRRVEVAVRQVFGHLSPRDQLTAETFANLTRQVRALVEQETPTSRQPTSWLTCLLPPPEMEDDVLRESGVLDEAPEQSTVVLPSAAATASLRRLLDETSDLIESPTFSHVLALLLDAAFSVLLDEKVAQGAFELPAQGPSSSQLSDSNRVIDLDLVQLQSLRQVLLPKILSLLTRQAHAIGNGIPNEYLQAMEQVRDLEGFAAVVYSSNWEADIRGEEATAAVVAAAAAAATTTIPNGAMPPQPEVAASAPVPGSESVVVIDASQGGSSSGSSTTAFESAWARATSEQG